MNSNTGLLARLAGFALGRAGLARLYQGHGIGSVPRPIGDARRYGGADAHRLMDADDVVENRPMQTGIPFGDDSLIERADRAIADAIATRRRVRADLDQARQNARRARSVVGLLAAWRPAPSPALEARPRPQTVTPSAIIAAPDGRDDPKIEAEWRRIQPTIETPLDLFGGLSRRQQRS